MVVGIKALFDGANAGLDLAHKATRAAKLVDSSESLQARFDEAAADVHRQVGQVSYAVCRALVAHALGRHPSDEEVTVVMTNAVNDPAFPNRAFRLLGEARKAASHRRRAFLAAMLFGLPFVRVPDDDRDRIDMVVERIMTADVELLRLIAQKDHDAPRPSAEDAAYYFPDSNVVALTRGLDVRIATTLDQWEGGFSDQAYSDDRYSVNHAAFASLLSLSCIEVGDMKATQGDWLTRCLAITPLGKLVIRAVEEVRPGFDGIRG